METSAASDAVRGDSADALGGEPFRIDEEQPEPGTFVVSVHGEADLHVVGRLRDRLSDVTDRDPRLVVVDLSDAGFLDSTSIAVLLRAMKRVQSRGGRFRVVVPRSDLRRIFEVTLLDRVFALAASRQEALADANARPRKGAAPL